MEVKVDDELINLLLRKHIYQCRTGMSMLWYNRMVTGRTKFLKSS